MKTEDKKTLLVVGIILGLALVGYEPGERETPVAQAYECEELKEGETPSGEIPVCGEMEALNDRIAQWLESVDWNCGSDLDCLGQCLREAEKTKDIETDICFEL